MASARRPPGLGAAIRVVHVDDGRIRVVRCRVEALAREPGVITLARIARGLGVALAELWRDVA